jgi:hypothetical protein
MDDLTAADFRLLLSLLKFAIVAPEQRERVQSALEEAQEVAEIDEAPAPYIPMEDAQRIRSKMASEAVWRPYETSKRRGLSADGNSPL